MCAALRRQNPQTSIKPPEIHGGKSKTLRSSLEFNNLRQFLKNY